MLPLARGGIPNVTETNVCQANFGGQILDIKMLITIQMMVASARPLHHRDQSHILHKMCHFQPFVKFQLSKHFSCGTPFARMPKMAGFSGLRNQRLRCEASIVSLAKPLSFNCLIRTFIPSILQ